ncbi:DedA family protein [Pengzhenrongella sp.]|uniref:DedA family protein n=1 Tax=Pengzhenrongella sp. TaxID=2888820 RepID=UPI002F94C466
MLNGLADWLLAVPAPAAYAAIALLVFSEAAIFVGFVLPGETAVILGGVLAETGRLSLSMVIVIVVVAAILGDSVGFEVGRHLGPRVLRSRILRRHEVRVARAQGFLRERGGWAVFLGRFTAFLRAVMPALAGTSRMPYPRFLAFNAAGGLAWGTGFVLVGYFAGQSYGAVEKALGRGSGVLALVAAAAALLWWHRRRKVTPILQESVDDASQS